MDLRPLIESKKRGQELDTQQIKAWIEAVVTKRSALHQESALLMAILFRGMSLPETVQLTRTMAKYGHRLRKPRGQRRIGKHSTGGVGDKTTFLLGPLLASYGVQVPFMSGRGLGHTGGTIDKLSGLKGLQTNLTPQKVDHLLENIGFCIFEQNRYFAPADQLLYGLRDVTGTVDSIPLIVSSIISKKMQEGLDGLVLDVKYGAGALMRDLAAAKHLANTLLDVAKQLRLKATVVLSSMEQPLGHWVGNNAEIIECDEVFRGEGAKDLIRVSTVLAYEMLALAKLKKQLPSQIEIKNRLLSGALSPAFWRALLAHGNSRRILPKPSLATKRIAIRSPASGWIRTMDAREVGAAAMRLGAGRDKINAKIDPRVGIRLLKKIGDPIKQGEVWAELACHPKSPSSSVAKQLRMALEIGQKKQRPRRLIAGVLKNH